ncbi:MFS general substrate transporter [Fomitiporia mediterranea MF3/22]|uniref:MFS general substrate transporter n=1 Tax=Fomitiporia mediterranea (strain MF3/22) TaxID=694068 RepID=UPI00044081D1|nr:MFS general substrate transporter [Fomitiporia mediterranea MF3/22]EJC99149.1 MFS general substrate transporter [Fomitiporia mediterranea MF3/22]
MALVSHADAAQLPLVSDDLEVLSKPRERKPLLSKEKRVEYVALASLMWSLFMEGWNDATTGPLLPVIQSHYKIGYTIVSLVFVLSGTGFVVSAIANVYLSHKVGFGKVVMMGAVSQVIAYCIQSAAPPFPAFVLAYFFSGFGVAIQNAQSIDFCVSVDSHSATKMGLVQSAYGIGALVAPIVAMRFAVMPRWSFHFLVSLGGALLNSALLLYAFRLKNLDEILTRAGQPTREKSETQESHYSQLLKLKILHFIAIFLLLLVGVEFAVGGWIVTFVMVDRGGGTSSAYLSSGFFAGMFLGRVTLLYLNKLLGDIRAVWLYLLLCLGFEISIWVVPSFIENAIAVSFFGFFNGPIHPILMNMFGRLIPPWLMSGAVGLTIGLEQTGTAIIPFIAGAMASRFGIWSLHPLIVSILGFLLVMWAFVPFVAKPPDETVEHS